jgi:hypothetical protein
MIVEKNLKVAKEVSDVGEALVGIVKAFRAGKPVQEVAVGELPKVLAALDGVDQIDDELKADRKVALATLGYHTGELADAILGQKA